MKNYIGRKMIGFYIENGLSLFPNWYINNEDNIGKIGTIFAQEGKNVLVNFVDDTSSYVFPISMIEEHLIQE